MARPGAELRVAVDRPTLASALVVGAVGRPLTPVVADLDTPATRCVAAGFERPARDPRGVPILPQDVVVEWERRLRDPGSDARWLLAPVDGVPAFVEGAAPGVEGLQTDGGRVELCSALPLPDLGERLRHAALVPWTSDREGRAEGPGPFFEAAAGRFERNPGYLDDPPLPAALVRVDGADGAGLVERGEADLALAYGHAAGRVAEAAGAELETARVPAWDRRVLLWMNPRTRWLNDPYLRRWIASRVDRTEALALLFDGRGATLDALVDGPASAPATPPERRPLARDTVARFDLGHAAGDPHARSLAARLKARLRQDGLEVTLRPLAHDRLAAALREGSLPAAVLAFEPSSPEPWLALRELVTVLGPSAADAAIVLDQAAALEGTARAGAVAAAQDLLTADAIVVPLVSLDAWLVTRRGLVGVRAGPRRTLDLAAAGYR